MKIQQEHSWSYAKEQEIAFASRGEGAAYSELNIVRLAPGDGQLQLDWQYDGSEDVGEIYYEVKLVAREHETEVGTYQLPVTASGALLRDLDNTMVYKVVVRLMSAGEDRPLAESPERLFRTGEVPGIVINYIHPEDYTYGFSGRSSASPSIVKLPNGTWIASHDVYWGKAGQNLTKLFGSGDGGQSWSFLCDLYPCFWGKLFIHRGYMYMLGTSTEYGSLLIGRSEDGGKTWSAPVELLPAGSREQGGPHRAPMPVVEWGGRIWTAVEFGSWQNGGHATGVISAAADLDLLDPSNWIATTFLPYDREWPGTIKGGEKPSLLEGNIVITPDGNLVNLLRYHTKGGDPDYGRAIILKVDDTNPEAPLSFGKVIDFHGNMSKFSVQFDRVTRKYWSLVNRVSTSNVSQRNILTLVSSDDLEHWEIHRDVLNYQDIGWPEDDKKVGFQYVDWQIEGDNLVYVSRTAINGAYNYHNANYLTFHMIEHFRDY